MVFKRKGAKRFVGIGEVSTGSSVYRKSLRRKRADYGNQEKTLLIGKTRREIRLHTTLNPSGGLPRCMSSSGSRQKKDRGGKTRSCPRLKKNTESSRTIWKTLAEVGGSEGGRRGGGLLEKRKTIMNSRIVNPERRRGSTKGYNIKVPKKLLAGETNRQRALQLQIERTKA